MRLAPKLEDERQTVYIESVRRSGAWDAAVPDLARYLAGQQIPVASEDCEALRRVLARLGDSAEEVVTLTHCNKLQIGSEACFGSCALRHRVAFLQPS